MGSIRDILDEEMGHKVRQVVEASLEGYAMSVYRYSTELAMLSTVEREDIYEMVCDLRDLLRAVS